jgi:hypothetical protein
VVVLGANAKNRLGVVNGTTAIITDLDLRGRAMTVRTLEEEPPRTIRLPGWYLDAAIQPGQSRRVDLAYARTDMRSQGRTEQRALLALDGAEDMQGGCQVGRDVGLGQAGGLDDVADPVGAVQELLHDDQAAVVAEAVEQHGPQLGRGRHVSTSAYMCLRR